MTENLNISALNAAIDFCDLWLQRQTDLNEQVPGHSIAIMHDDSLVYNKSFGFANHDTKEILTPNHLFLSASHTKSFTALSILQLVEANKLSLTDKLTYFIPQLKSNPDTKINDVTIEHLLSHSSGLSRDGDDATFFSCLRAFPTKDEILSFYETSALLTTPGKIFRYSNFAYALLGYILEDVSGLSFEDYITTHIFKPLELNRICASYDPNNAPYSAGHNKYAPGTKKIIPINSNIDTKGMIAAAGVCSNPESLCRFYSALMIGTGLLLSDRLKEKMLSKYFGVDQRQPNFGYGLGVVHNIVGGYRLNGHTGGMPGHLSRTYINPKANIVISIMTNSYAADTAMLQNGLWHIIDHFQKHYRANTKLSSYCGEFYNHWGSYYFMPLGETIFVTNLNTPKPFEKAPEIEKSHTNDLVITKDSGYSTLYETVIFNRTKNGIKDISYGSAKLFQKDDYILLLETLPNHA